MQTQDWLLWATPAHSRVVRAGDHRVLELQSQAQGRFGAWALCRSVCM